MKKFRVQATPRGGACYQEVEARDENEAVYLAQKNKNGWSHASPKSQSDWNFHAREVK